MMVYNFDLDEKTSHKETKRLSGGLSREKEAIKSFYEGQQAGRHQDDRTRQSSQPKASVALYKLFTFSWVSQLKQETGKRTTPAGTGFFFLLAEEKAASIKLNCHAILGQTSKPES